MKEYSRISSWYAVKAPWQKGQTMIKISEEEAFAIIAFVKNHEREEIPDDVWELCMRLYDEVC